MKKYTLLLLLLLLFYGCAAPPQPADHRHDQPSEFYLYLPKDYTPDRKWPLFVGIHGAGGSGKDCWSMWQRYADQEGYVLICPSLADAGGGWYQGDGERKVVDIVNHVHQNYSVEPKMFLAGFSAGGQFVTGLTAHYHSWVKGTAVLSAGNYMLPTKAAKDVPYLIVIGEKDHAASISRARGFHETLRASGFNATLEVLPGVGHTVPKQAKQFTLSLFRSVNP